VREKLISPLRELAHSVVARGRIFLATDRERRVINWVESGFDRTLRLDYELDDTAIVFDVGGYEGQWASDIFARYCCTVHVFEPNTTFAATIRRRFAQNPKIVVHDFGLAHISTDEAQLHIKGQGSSLFRRTGSSLDDDSPIATVRLVRAADFLAQYGFDKVDLMKINIEGAEYDLLDHLIDTGVVRQVRNIQVQFHDFVPDAHERMSAIHRRLSDTHVLTFQSEFVWENWALNHAVPRP